MPALLVLVALFALAAPGFASAASPRVLVTGDSMVMPLDEQLVRPVKRAGGLLIRDPRPGTILTKPVVFDWVRHATRQVGRHRPHATVMFIGVTDFEALRDATGREVDCCHRTWIAAYAWRVAQMMSTYRRDGRADVYWLTLPAARNRAHSSRIAAVNAAIALAGAIAADRRIHVVDTVPVLTPGFRYRRTMRYRGKRIVVRDEDGVHLSRGGARVVRDLVVRAMRRDGVLGR